MNVSPSKENILKRIRKALSHPTPLPFPQSEGNHPVMQTQSDDLAVEFAQRFSALQGKFVFCGDNHDCATQLKGLIESRGWGKIVCHDDVIKKILSLALPSIAFHNDLSSSDAAVTGCEFLVSRTGTIVLSSADAGGRTTSVYSPVHICIAFSDQLVYDIKDALSNMKERYGNRLPSMISFATGPSRTADIEKTLVVGVHGPGEVFVFLVDAPTDKD